MAFPLVAPLGTTSLIVWSSIRLILTAIVPLKVTCRGSPVLAPKFSPAIITSAPGPALVGVTERILGCATDSSSSGARVAALDFTSIPDAVARPSPDLAATRLKRPTATLLMVKVPSEPAFARYEEPGMKMSTPSKFFTVGA
ncbi:hypothetical protein D3C87_1726670 [compost metagenome]